MQHNATKIGDRVDAGVEKNTQALNGTRVGGVFTATCYDKDGNLKWEASFHNLVVNVGLKDMNEKYLTGSSYTAAWYLGLVNSGGTYAAADTMSSHAGWTENTGYSQSTRPAATFGTSTTADPSVIATSSASTFSINATSTIGGAFLTSDNTKSGTSGILFSVGNFTGGNRSVVSGDTLNVSYQLSNDAV